MNSISCKQINALFEMQSKILVVLVFRCLAGDCIYVVTPGGNNLLIDCGFHKGNYIIDIIKSLYGALEHIIITHQHLDHFATMSKFVHEFSPRGNMIHHSGVHYPRAFVPNTPLTSCSEYDGLEVPLWNQYHAIINNEERWKTLNLENLEIVNLLPDKNKEVREIDSYHSLNNSSTPIGIRFFSHKVVIGSDVTSDEFEEIANSKYADYLSNLSLYIPSSHGRPKNNPRWLLQIMKPKYVCISDSFPDGNFKDYYKEILAVTDVRSVNTDNNLVYVLHNNGLIEHFALYT
jgi:beta-lactamase superfamily II metal-dependent hydrolase